MKNGNSLCVNITKMCRRLGLNAGDRVLVDLTKDFTDRIGSDSALNTNDGIMVLRRIFETERRALFLTQLEFFAYEMTGTPDRVTKEAAMELVLRGDLEFDNGGRLVPAVWKGPLSNGHGDLPGLDW